MLFQVAKHIGENNELSRLRKSFGRAQSWSVTLIGGNYSSGMKMYTIHSLINEYDFNLIGQNILTGKTENIWLDAKLGICLS